jgi:hypothetical protein
LYFLQFVDLKEVKVLVHSLSLVHKNVLYNRVLDKCLALKEVKNKNSLGAHPNECAAHTYAPLYNVIVYKTTQKGCN